MLLFAVALLSLRTATQFLMRYRQKLFVIPLPTTSAIAAIAIIKVFLPFQSCRGMYRKSEKGLYRLYS